MLLNDITTVRNDSLMSIFLGWIFKSETSQLCESWMKYIKITYIPLFNNKMTYATSIQYSI